MTRDRRLTFRERDLKTALKVLQERGLKVSRVEVRQDGVIVIPCEGGEAAADPEAAENLKAKEILKNAAQNVKAT
jgi:glucokinase